ncbi:MAG: flagellar hook-basal body protein [Candidatus Krumholzibacteriota bacterium]|nr:flagellar hook-basal body protein [Candidatus Krumholzibacteriota bacterium]
MLKGISMAARAMKNQVARNDMIANNLANINSAGFKKDFAVFAEQKTDSGLIDTIVKVATSFSQGQLTRTERPLDVAIQGDGFFVIETDEGEMYTRDGSFTVNSEGNLATSNGQLVAGSIAIPPGEIEISREGNIRVDGIITGQLRIVRFDETSSLEKAGSSLLTAPDDISPTDLAPEEITVLSGFLENSNVEVISEMTEMITALKAYEISQKALKSEDEILHMLTSTVGKTG